MYQAETPAGLCKYKDNEKGKLGDSLKLWIISSHVVDLVDTRLVSLCIL